MKSIAQIEYFPTREAMFSLFVTLVATCMWVRRPLANPAVSPCLAREERHHPAHFDTIFNSVGVVNPEWLINEL